LSKDLTYAILTEFKAEFFFVNNLHLLSMPIAPKDWFTITPLLSTQPGKGELLSVCWFWLG